MKASEFIEWARIVNESGGDLDIEAQGKLLSIAESWGRALSFLAGNEELDQCEHCSTKECCACCQEIARRELDKEVG